MMNDYLQIAALNHYPYCPHRWWRMFCLSDFIDNQYTIEGTSLHERVHTPSELNQGETWQIRSIWLKSEQYKLIGKSDLIEEADGQFFPVEYKRGRKGEWDNDELQVCAQALCLEEMTGKSVNIGYVYYASSCQRQLVEISPQLREQVIAIINAIHNHLTMIDIPKPSYSKKCKGCSLYSRCLPQASKKVSRYQET